MRKRILEKAIRRIIKEVFYGFNDVGIYDVDGFVLSPRRICDEYVLRIVLNNNTFIPICITGISMYQMSIRSLVSCIKRDIENAITKATMLD